VICNLIIRTSQDVKWGRHEISRRLKFRKWAITARIQLVERHRRCRDANGSCGNHCGPRISFGRRKWWVQTGFRIPIQKEG